MGKLNNLFILMKRQEPDSLSLSTVRCYSVGRAQLMFRVLDETPSFWVVELLSESYTSIAD